MQYINYMQPNYDECEIIAVNEYMNSGGWLTEFTQTRTFEEDLAEFVGSRFCSVLSNGTVTLIAALMACDVHAGDEVIVPDFTMSATSHAVELIGAHAVFVDVERDTFCMNYVQMLAAITPKTKAVIFVDLNGRYSNTFVQMIEFCKINNLWLIEDAAQALGSTCNGKPLGTFGDIGSFSFSMPKIITTGQGGAIVTNNDLLFNKILKIRDFGRESTGSDHYMAIGCNFKFTDLQAVIGIEQVKKLAKRISRKKEICFKYDSLLAGFEQVELVKNNYLDTAPCFYEILCDNRDKLKSFLFEHSIGSREFYPPLHSEPAYGYNHLSFPVTEEISAKGLWLPSSSTLTDEQIEYICSIIKDFYMK